MNCKPSAVSHRLSTIKMKSLIWILAGSAAAVPLVSNSETKVINIPAIETQPPRGNEPGAAPPLVNSATTGVTTHGAYSGTPTTTGAEQYPSTLAATIPIQPNPTATYYNPNGKLTEPMPMPYMPAGGVGTNGTVPVYMVQSDLTTSPWLWASTRNISSWTFYTMVSKSLASRTFSMLVSLSRTAA